MPQFNVYKNRNADSRATYPLLLDIQANLLDALQTRIVVPLTKLTANKKALQGATPVVVIDGEQYLLMTPQLAGVAARELGPLVASIADQRDIITAALDFVFFGI